MSFLVPAALDGIVGTHNLKPAGLSEPSCPTGSRASVGSLNGLGTRGCVQFAVQNFEVGLHCVDRYAQLCGNLGVRQVAGKQSEECLLAWCQLPARSCHFHWPVGRVEDGGALEHGPDFGIGIRWERCDVTKKGLALFDYGPSEAPSLFEDLGKPSVPVRGIDDELGLKVLGCSPLVPVSEKPRKRRSRVIASPQIWRSRWSEQGSPEPRLSGWRLRSFGLLLTTSRPAAL